MTPTPGDNGGDCPECDDPLTLVGYGSVVLAAYCEECGVLVPLAVDMELWEI